jgi:chromosome segregation ATPase
MALTAEDLRDLVALLQAHPEWRKVLWALLASEEVLRMPTGLADLRDELARLQVETERRFMELAEAVRRLSEAFVNHRQEFLAHQAQVNARFAELSAEVRALAEAQRRMEEFLQRLVEAQRHTEESLQRLAEAFAAHRQEFIAHRQEFLVHREETNRRFAELAEAQRRTEESLQRLAEAFAAHRQEFIAHRQEFLEFRAETDRRFAELAEALRILTERVDRVEARLDRVEVRLDRVERRQEDHSRDLGELKSMRLEALYAEKPAVLFRSLLRRAAIVPDARQAEILEEAVAAGRITMEEADRAAPLDALVEGFHRREDRRVYLAVEISWQGTTKDVGRAVERAAVFARALGAEVIPVVAAKELTAPARRMARARGVWWLQDGRAFAPQEIPEEGPGEDDVETPT